MNCAKCGAELRREQKVCIVCGTRTVAGGNFSVGEKEPWRPTRQMIYAAGGVVLLLTIVIIAMSLRVTPPNVIAQEWFDAMVQRSTRKAQQFHSPELTSKMQTGVSDSNALSDYLYDEVNGKQGTYKIGEPIYDVPSSPTRATVTVTMSYPSGDPPREIPIGLVKAGRRWLIANVAY